MQSGLHLIWLCFFCVLQVFAVIAVLALLAHSAAARQTPADGGLSTTQGRGLTAINQGKEWKVKECKVSPDEACDDKSVDACCGSETCGATKKGCMTTMKPACCPK